MYRRNSLLVALGLSILPMPYTAIGAPADQQSQQIASVANAPSSGVSDPLFRARWSLPSNGVIPKLESPKESGKTQSDADFATPAELAAHGPSKPKPTSEAASPDLNSKSTGTAAAAVPASSSPLPRPTPKPPTPTSKQPPVVRLILQPNTTDQKPSSGSVWERMQQESVKPSQGNGQTPPPPGIQRPDATNLLRPEMPEVPVNQSRSSIPASNADLLKSAKTKAPGLVESTQSGYGTASSAEASSTASFLAIPSTAGTLSATPSPDALTAVESVSPASVEHPSTAATVSVPRELTATEQSTTASDSTAVAPEGTKVIEAGVSLWDSANISKVVEHLVDLNFVNSKEAKDLDKKVQHFSSKPVRAFASAKDALNQSFVYEGTDPSQRMGKLVLEDKAKIRDHVTAEYERQKYVDKIHSQIISALSQIATGLGTADSVRKAQIVDSGVKSLSNLVGAEQADKAMISLTSWLSSAKVADSVFERPAWDTMERDSKLESVLRGAFEKDPVISAVKKRVNRYANPGKLKSGTSRAVETTLTMASWLAPGWTIPIAAEAALDGFIAATGGTEESKIEKELIYDKRIQSRLKVLSSEASLALDNYRFAVVTKNPPLLTFSEALIADMSNDNIAEEVLGGQVDANKQLAQQAIPEIKESKVPEPPKGTKVKRIVRTLKDL